MREPALDIDEKMPAIRLFLKSPTSAINFQAGTRIFNANDAADCAYMIDQGYVEIAVESYGQRETLELLGPGDIFGEMEILDGKPRITTATAVHDTNVLSISREQLLDDVNQSGSLTRQILVATLYRLRSVQEKNNHEVKNRLEQVSTNQDEDTQYQSVRTDAANQLRQRYDLAKAIENRQFDLAYQPIVNLLDGRTAGFEALLRWPQPDGTTVTPDQFIPLAEKTKLIVPLGVWILERALEAIQIINFRATQRGLGSNGTFVSINVSPRQLENELDVERIANLIEQSNVDPNCIKLEITEQALLDDPRMATIALARLKSTGASIAIDDFGTGYSSLNYLHRFPLDTLKIDRSFVSRIVDDKNRQYVVAAIIGLARDLGMQVVAEGIEEKDELQWLRDHACRYAQGYLLSKPVPFKESLAYLESSFDF